jgi:7,8-dihydropterin-6-yl-methyl-4-(beta-D-ribofuranosyl)aminobenzene 5'-phosphate synthase
MKLLAFVIMLIPIATILCATSGAVSPNGKQITILYDAFGKLSNLRKDWGYSALIEYGGKRILFDTGSNAEFFKHNVAALKIDLSHLDLVVISHRHGDHTSGLSYVLSMNPNVTIYAPSEVSGFGTLVLPSIMAAINRHDPSLPDYMHYFDGVKQDTRPSGGPWPTAHFKQIDETTEVAPGIFLISNISDVPGTKEMHEISLVICTPPRPRPRRGLFASRN